MPSVAQDPAQAPPLPRGAPGGPMASVGSLHHPLGPASKARPTQGQAAVPKYGRTPAAWPAPAPVCSQVEEWALALWTPRRGCCVALEPWPALSEPLVPTVDWTLVSIMDKAQGLPRSPSIQPGKEQNGDSHHSGDWRGPGRDLLPLPVRSRKYQEGPDSAERRPREGGHSPLDSADVRVQLPRTSIPRAPSSDEECFFDLLSKFQSSRMDDQRCPLEDGQPAAAEATATPTLEGRVAQPSLTASPQTEEFFDLIASSQSRRLDDQRASVGSLPGLRITHNNLGHLRGDGDPQEPGDEFFNMLIKCQSSRIDDQRCPPPDVPPRGPTMPDEDFFSLIQRVQAKRMDEQRVDLAGSPEQEVGGPPESRQQCQPGAS